MLIHGCLVFVLLANFAMAAPPAADGDYETLPPDPVALEATLASLKVDMTAAANAATLAGGGQISAIRLIQLNGSWVYEVILTDSGLPKRAIVDAMTGEVRVAKMSSADAVKVATEKVPGKAGMITSDPVSDPPTWKVVVFHEGKAHMVTLNAVDSTVISDEIQQRFPGEPTDAAPQGEPGGVQWIVLAEGTGASPKAADSMVKVNYTGYLVDGTSFDSNKKTGRPAEFRLNRVVKGWTQGVLAMKIGEKRKIIIPPSMAWGDAGRSPQIPPRAAVVFDVELVDADMPPPAVPAGGMKLPTGGLQPPSKIPDAPKPPEPGN